MIDKKFYRLNGADMTLNNIALFPHNTSVNSLGNLTIDNLDINALADEFGTPLYVYDESTIRSIAKEYKSQFQNLYPDTKVAYASKAFMSLSMAKIAKDEGLSLDVVSGGEVSIAAKSGFPTSEMYFHGNNKTPHELSEAIDLGVGTIVVDGFHELRLLNQIAKDKNVRCIYFGDLKETDTPP